MGPIGSSHLKCVVTLISGLVTSETLMVRKMILGLWAQMTAGVRVVAAILRWCSLCKEGGCKLGDERDDASRGKVPEG